jgi:(2Fe-2S) ferredoxin
MNQPRYHILVCNSFRTSGLPQGVCNKKGAAGLLAVLEEGIADRGLDAMVTATGCLKVCDRGPALIVHPGNWWYGSVDETKIDAILDALAEDRPVEEFLLG